MTEKGWSGLPQLSKTLYQETYFLPNENYETWLHRITQRFESDKEHGDRIRNYIHNYWYHPSTPIASGRGLPIACYISHIDDNREGIFEGYFEGMWLGAEGGGRGVYWGEVGGNGRPIGFPKHLYENLTWSEIQADDAIPKSSGVIPFLAPSDRLTYSISQAGVRRSTEASYIRIDHCDIEDFIDIRLETGDPNSRMPNLHHGIAITDEFMEAVNSLSSWDLIEPHSGKVVKTVDAFDLWMDILLVRKTEAGEPFIIFIDTINNNLPEDYVISGRTVKSSNICTEIMLHTDKDTTAVCNIGSFNLEQWDEYEPQLFQVMLDIQEFHDNINTYFIDTVDAIQHPMTNEAFRRARKAVYEERNIGIGVMGWHSLLQQRGIPFEAPMAIGLNKKIFGLLKRASDNAQVNLVEKRGPCPLSKATGTNSRRNIHTLATAPTMSISNLSWLASSGIEPLIANAFVKKLPQGTFVVQNRYLDEIIKTEAYNSVTNEFDAVWYQRQWQEINKANGSVMNLDWMDEYTKEVFKTAFEIDPRSVIRHAADRQPDIDQSQSLNVFLPAECTYEELHAVHMMAWEEGVKSLYYLRSEPEANADTSNKERKPITLEDDACVSCT